MSDTIETKALWSKLHGPMATWDACVEQARHIELEWSFDSPTPIATAPCLAGWRQPLWAVQSQRLWLLRPEGVWRANLPKLSGTFMLRKRAIDGHRGALFVDPQKTGKVWRLETGAPVDLDALDAKLSPTSIRKFADYLGALQSCGQDLDGACRIELDDHFERGPLRLERHGPWLLASNGVFKVAYGLGEQSRMWRLLEANPCRVALGSDTFTSWVPRTVLDPVMLEPFHSP